MLAATALCAGTAPALGDPPARWSRAGPIGFAETDAFAVGGSTQFAARVRGGGAAGSVFELGRLTGDGRFVRRASVAMQVDDRDPTDRLAAVSLAANPRGDLVLAWMWGPYVDAGDASEQDVTHAAIALVPARGRVVVRAVGAADIAGT
ncbi:MAG TPA: hypothetical protein VFR49_05260, partial [Solirubrobacteraceae bacterium]|nr:hypothetical protein [Solirubrobacteraceae bacterium]